MLDWDTCSEVESKPEIFSGALVFKNSRIPVSALFENINDGSTIQDFIEWFPGVQLKQVHAVLEHANRSLVSR